jgi:hypothetical protein
MFISIITDCHDENARGRQESRLQSLTGHPTSFIGVQSDLEAGVNLLEVLDATGGHPGLVLVNVAPRGTHALQWENGTPFGYFYHKDTLVIATVDGLALAGAKRCGLVEHVHLLDTHSASEAMLAANFISAAEAARIPGTQFRSFDFTPRVGAFLLAGHSVPTETFSLEPIAPLPTAIWHIDNFGNCKTTLTADDIAGKTELQTRYGTFPIVRQLRDVPEGETAITLGSSGLDSTRFCELVVQRQSFAKHHDATIGDDLFSPISHFHQATD